MSEFERLIRYRGLPPDWSQDGLTVRTRVELRLIDRLKLLFGWTMEVQTFTATENICGRTETLSCVRLFNETARALLRRSDMERLVQGEAEQRTRERANGE